jgi:crotonobetainyl-CoA:carnitine CoA-transferase CaiB-like acyl-CoA transferase
VPTHHLQELGGKLPFPPAYGEDTDAVLKEVGLSADNIKTLHQRGVIAR